MYLLGSHEEVSNVQSAHAGLHFIYSWYQGDQQLWQDAEPLLWAIRQSTTAIHANSGRGTSREGELALTPSKTGTPLDMAVRSSSQDAFLSGAISVHTTQITCTQCIIADTLLGGHMPRPLSVPASRLYLSEQSQ
jgi:hypothetical protein